MKIHNIPDAEELRELAKTYRKARPDAICALKRFLYVAGETERVLEGHFARYGLSRARFSLLMSLYQGPDDGLAPSEIAERLNVTRGNMTGLIDGLLQAGYILKIDDPEDRRVIKIRLSKNGVKLLEKTLPDHFERTSKAFEVMTKKDIQSFEAFLDKMQTGLNLMEKDLEQSKKK